MVMRYPVLLGNWMCPLLLLWRKMRSGKTQVGGAVWEGLGGWG